MLNSALLPWRVLEGGLYYPGSKTSLWVVVREPLAPVTEREASIGGMVLVPLSDQQLELNGAQLRGLCREVRLQLTEKLLAADPLGRVQFARPSGREVAHHVTFEQLTNFDARRCDRDLRGDFRFGTVSQNGGVAELQSFFAGLLGVRSSTAATASASSKSITSTSSDMFSPDNSDSSETSSSCSTSSCMSSVAVVVVVVLSLDCRSAFPRRCRFPSTVRGGAVAMLRPLLVVLDGGPGGNDGGPESDWVEVPVQSSSTERWEALLGPACRPQRMVLRLSSLRE